MFSSNNRQTSSQPRRGARPFGKLRINTQVAANGAVFPYETRVQQLTFVSFEESKARKNANTEKKSLRQRLEDLTPILSGPKQVLPELKGSNGTVRSRKGAIVAPNSAIQESHNGLAPPAGKRIRALRPEPLVLSQDVSPSDRAIPIGISLSPSTISNNTTPHSTSSWERSPAVPGQEAEKSYAVHGTRDVNTPMIIITPAKDRFSPTDVPQIQDYRPASSIYSRYTNCYPKFGDTAATPPVPPLPLFVNNGNMKSHFSTFTRESTATAFEEDVNSKRSTAGLPTPRRSKGWWNLITSPFSAKSTGTGAFFWRSPSPEQDAERVPVLGDAAEMAQSHGGVIFLNRAPDDDELRSAPADSSHVDLQGGLGRALPKRSDTAPGAIDANSSVVNIYTIPTTGEAAAYYDQNRHFPSLCLDSNRTIAPDDVRGWSPSQSVFIPERSPVLSPDTLAHTPTVMEAALEAEDIFEVDDKRQAPAAAPGKAKPLVFSTPSADELKTPPATTRVCGRSVTQNTMDSMMSPLSATPEIQDAHIARFVNPQKRSEMEPTEPARGLAAATMTHSRQEYPFEKEAPRSAHVRQDSHGLGISSERDLFPPPVHLSEKPRLGTDKFGQLTIRSWEDNDPPQPWYRRFFWLLAAGIGALLLLLIVLLVVFIPQRHGDMLVQASWLNLTGFPAIAIGVSTVIQPKKVQSTDSCITPSSMWSCAAPGQSDESVPNLRMEIRFRNGTLPVNETASTASSAVKRWQDTSKLHQFVKRSIWSDQLYSASPSPPSDADQKFLGRTTDNISEPYNGEETPFYISLLDTTAIVKSKLRKRDSDWSYPYPDDSGEQSSSNGSTSAGNEIPSPAVEANGEPVAEILYPLVTAQPLRLYNRGQDSEHYGFYSYFDRVIYTSGASDTSQLNNTNIVSNVVLSNASAVCTFSQTRFLVQIWTKKGTVATLNTTDSSAVASSSSANDMSAPGSFPLPVTVTLDRHGGVAAKKGVYCYGLDNEHHVVGNVKTWIYETRGSSLINPAIIPGSNEASHEKRSGDSEGTGIDGGTGGCECQYQNSGS